jgi:mono/diheme cytochrome c family protein
MSTLQAVKLATLGAALVITSAVAKAQGLDIGKAEFNNSCAVCHGTSGKGNGPLSGMLTQKVADLTILKKKNNGVFPFNEVYSTIEGGKAVKGHGTSDMPAWGNIYNEKAPQMTGPYADKSDYRSFVRGRILALIGYIDSLQAK